MTITEQATFGSMEDIAIRVVRAITDGTYVVHVTSREFTVVRNSNMAMRHLKHFMPERFDEFDGIVLRVADEHFARTAQWVDVNHGVRFEVHPNPR